MSQATYLLSSLSATPASGTSESWKSDQLSSAYLPIPWSSSIGTVPYAADIFFSVDALRFCRPHGLRTSASSTGSAPDIEDGSGHRRNSSERTGRACRWFVWLRSTHPTSIRQGSQR